MITLLHRALRSLQMDHDERASSGDWFGVVALVDARREHRLVEFTQSEDR